jgi:hypothetical protein
MVKYSKKIQLQQQFQSRGVLFIIKSVKNHQLYLLSVPQANIFPTDQTSLTNSRLMEDQKRPCMYFQTNAHKSLYRKLTSYS